MWLSLKVKPVFSPESPSIFGVLEMDASDPVHSWVEKSSHRKLVFTSSKEMKSDDQRRQK